MDSNTGNNSSGYTAGIDIGSAYSKAVILTGTEMKGWAVIASGNSYRQAADKVFNEALAKVGVESGRIERIAATGSGASSVAQATKTISEITCQAKAVNFLLPSVRTVIDIGAQFSRVFRVDSGGRAMDFVISEKCAGGSGRLLQVIARVLHVDITELGALSIKATQKVDFTTSCAVFIESEVISRVAEGCAKEDIIAGVQKSLGTKVRVLAERVGFNPDFAFVGGSANNAGLVRNIEEIFETRVLVPPQPQIVAALGAALLAGED